MKTFNKAITVICTFLLILSSISVFANTDDPVVSLSYLSEIFAPNFKNEIKNEIKEMIYFIKNEKSEEWK